MNVSPEGDRDLPSALADDRAVCVQSASQCLAKLAIWNEKAKAAAAVRNV